MEVCVVIGEVSGVALSQATYDRVKRKHDVM